MGWSLHTVMVYVFEMHPSRKRHCPTTKQNNVYLDMLNKEIARSLHRSINSIIEFTCSYVFYCCLPCFVGWQIVITRLQVCLPIFDSRIQSNNRGLRTTTTQHFKIDLVIRSAVYVGPKARRINMVNACN